MYILLLALPVSTALYEKIVNPTNGQCNSNVKSEFDNIPIRLILIAKGSGS